MKTTLYSLVGVVIFLSVFNFYSFKRYKDCSSITEAQKTNNTEIYIHKIIAESSNNGQVIFTKPLSLTNYLGEEKLITKLKNAENQLFFCFSAKIHCSSCIVETILSLKQKFPDQTNVTLLAYESGIDDLKIMSQKLNYKFDTYLISDSIISKAITVFKKPFIFTFDKIPNSKKLFFVDPDLNNLTVKFLNQNF